ncbi:MAG: hypothetical protein U1E51_06805 [Candidatus Binatia bacterium]|nr:hypothetical protein [Candidatus Binatia bacterium]
MLDTFVEILLWRWNDMRRFYVLACSHFRAPPTLYADGWHEDSYALWCWFNRLPVVDQNGKYPGDTINGKRFYIAKHIDVTGSGRPLIFTGNYLKTDGPFPDEMTPLYDLLEESK